MNINTVIFKNNDMEFKGTKENWKITGKQECNSFYIGNDNGTVCYTAYSPGSAGEIESEANAKLIAAAPELLSALNELLIHALENDLHSEFTDEAKRVIEKALKIEINE